MTQQSRTADLLIRVSKSSFGQWVTRVAVASTFITAIIMIGFMYIREFFGLSNESMLWMTLIAVIWIVFYLLVQILQSVLRKNSAGELGLIDDYTSLIPLLAAVFLLTRWWDGQISLGLHEWIILTVYVVVALSDKALDRIISQILARRSLNMGDSND